jgi:hypothetical protein
MATTVQSNLLKHSKRQKGYPKRPRPNLPAVQPDQGDDRAFTGTEDGSSTP